MQTVLLYDIDGTLVTTAGAARQALLDVAMARFGDISGFDFGFGGMTDRGILRRGLRAVGVELDEALFTAVLDDYLGCLAGCLQRAAVHKLLPGAEAMVHASVGWAGVANGLGTGNIEAGARLKLAKFSVDALLPFGGFGCDAEDRAGLIAVGKARGAARLGVNIDDVHLVIVGDTPFDVEAARANGGVTLAVASGGATRQALVEAGAEVVVDSLDDAGALGALARLCRRV